MSFSFFPHNNHHSLSFFSFRILKKKKKKTICKVNSVNINLYRYCNNFANLHIFNLTDVSDFESLKKKLFRKKTEQYYSQVIGTSHLTKLEISSEKLRGYLVHVLKN